MSHIPNRLKTASAILLSAVLCIQPAAISYAAETGQYAETVENIMFEDAGATQPLDTTADIFTSNDTEQPVSETPPSVPLTTLQCDNSADQDIALPDHPYAAVTLTAGNGFAEGTAAYISVISTGSEEMNGLVAEVGTALGATGIVSGLAFRTGVLDSAGMAYIPEGGMDANLTVEDAVLILNGRKLYRQLEGGIWEEVLFDGYVDATDQSPHAVFHIDKEGTYMFLTAEYGEQQTGQMNAEAAPDMTDDSGAFLFQEQEPQDIAQGEGQEIPAPVSVMEGTEEEKQDEAVNVEIIDKEQEEQVQNQNSGEESPVPVDFGEPSNEDALPEENQQSNDSPEPVQVQIQDETEESGQESGRDTDINGQETDINGQEGLPDDQSSENIGQEGMSDDKQAEVIGQEGMSDDQQAEVIGQEGMSDDKNTELIGQEGMSQSTDDDEQETDVKVQEADTDEQEDGQEQDADGQDADTDAPATDETDVNTKEEEENKEEQETQDMTGLPMVEVPETPETTGIFRKTLSVQTLNAANGNNGLRGVDPASLVQEPVELDGVVIEKILLKWLSKSTGQSSAAGFDTLELNPTNDTVGNQQWQVDFAISGEFDHDPGTVEIIMPAYLWHDRNGNEPGYFTLAVPEDPEEGAEFKWKRVGDSIVFTNTKKISAATKAMIQGTFRDVTPHEMVDIDADPSSTYYQYRGEGHLRATINVETLSGTVATMDSNTLTATINTFADTAAATKTAYNPTSRTYEISWNKPDNLPAALTPANPEQYFYIRWYISGTAAGNQPFVMTTSDAVNGSYESMILGIQGDGNAITASPDGTSVTATLLNGYNLQSKSAYIWMAYKKSDFPDPSQVYTITNTQTITVTGVDDLIPHTLNSEQAIVEFSPAIVYSIEKVWDDNNDAIGVRPSTIRLSIYRSANGRSEHWKYVDLVPNPTAEQQAQGYGPWTYTWDDEAKGYGYSVSEYNIGGSFETWYEEGNNGDITVHHPNWRYNKAREYDEETHHWTLTNTLELYGTENNYTSLSKSPPAGYTDSTIYRTNHALNYLLGGKSTSLTFAASGKADTTSTWSQNNASGKLVNGVPAADAAYEIIHIEDYPMQWGGSDVTSDDVEMIQVTIDQPEMYTYEAMIQDSSIPEGSPGRYFDPMRYRRIKMDDQYTKADFYAHNGTTWIKVGELNGTTLSAMNGASASGMVLTLPDNTMGFKEDLYSYGAMAEFSFHPQVTVYPTEFVMSKLGDLDKLPYSLVEILSNKIMMDWYTYHREHLARAYLRGVGNTYHVIKRSPYEYSYSQSTDNRLLNELMRGNAISVPYNVSASYNTVWTWVHNIKNGTIVENTTSPDITLLDGHETTDIVLEDYLFGSAEFQEMPAGTMDLAYAQINQPSITDGFAYAKFPDAYTKADFEAYINDTWVKVGELNGTVLTAANGSTVSGMTIFLPAGSMKFREILHTYGASSGLSYRIGVRIYPNEYVKATLETMAGATDYLNARVRNTARSYVDTNGTESRVATESYTAYLHGRVYRVASWANKRFRYISNDQIKRRLKMHVQTTLVMQSNSVSRSDYDAAIVAGDIPYTDGGVWYDLLPMGMEPDIASIRLQSGDNITDAYTIDNYKGSGRTMLVVKADLGLHITYLGNNTAPPSGGDSVYPGAGYRQTQMIDFDCYYAWEEARKYGIENIWNTMVFENNNGEMGSLPGWKGEPDDPTAGNNNLSVSMTGADAAIVTDLDIFSSEPAFIYAGTYLEATEIDFAAETSIKKWVLTEGSGTWTYGISNDATVSEGAGYKYKVTIKSETGTQTKDMIVLDSIENYIPESQKEDYGDTQWKGIFRGIDVSGLRQDGVDAVVYYSTVDNLDISAAEYNSGNTSGVVKDILDNATDPATGERIWTTTMPADPSTVKAFAVDCSKDLDGNDYVLSDENAGIAFYVYMQAPYLGEGHALWGSGKNAPADPEQVDITNPNHNAHAYNQIYLDCTHIDIANTESHAYIHWEYVKIGITPFSLNVTKRWEDENDNDGLRPTSATVHLYADGHDTGKALTLDDSNNWTGTFNHILKYDYDNGDPNYSGSDDGHYISYSFVEDESQGYNASFLRVGNDVTIINKHDPEKIAINLTKTWADDEAHTQTRPESITVKLYADGKFTGTQKVIRPNMFGQWTADIENLYKYRNKVQVNYTITEDPVDDYVPTYDLTDLTGATLTNTYYPYGDLIVENVVSNATAAAQDTSFTYTLSLHNNQGLELIDRYDYTIYEKTQGADPSDPPVWSEIATGATGEIGNGGTFTLKDGQKIVIKDIPSHSAYYVTEDQVPGFTRQYTDNAGSIASSVEAHCICTNVYASSGRAQAEAFKILTGTQLEKWQFKFDLYQVDNGTRTRVRSATCLEDGSVQFGALNFYEDSDGKTYEYELVERQEIKSGYTYDDSVYTVQITPHDNGSGVMECTCRYFEGAAGGMNTPTEIFATNIYEFPDGHTEDEDDWMAMTTQEQADMTAAHQAEDFDPMQDTPVNPVKKKRPAAVFTNEYHATGSLSMRAWKMLSGRALTNNEFDIVLLSNEKGQNGEYTVLQTKHNDVNGDILFNPLSFNETSIGKTLYYYMKEVPGSDTSVIYDDSVYCFAVTVQDNKDGTLSFTQRSKAVQDTYDFTGSGWTTDAVTWIGMNGSVLETDTGLTNGDMLSYDGNEPEYTSGSTAMTFLGWNIYDTATGERIASQETAPETVEWEGHPLVAAAVFSGTDYISSNPATYEVTYTPLDDEGEIPLFTNTLQPGTIELTKQTQWAAGAAPDEDQEFTFVIRLVRPDGEPVDGETFKYDVVDAQNIGEMP